MKRRWFIWISLVFAGTGLYGVDYDVGPGQPLAAIADVPWESLQPGDNVRIHWRSTPYREKWVIGRQGLPNAPITVSGVPGPNGERPVISGEDATTPAPLNFWNEERGLIKIGGSNTPPNTTPEWIVIEGLELRSAHTSYTFTNDNGGQQSYVNNAAGVYVEYGRNLVIRDCVIHDNGNGIFIGSPDNDPTINVLIEGNWIYGNGNVGRFLEHNTYTTALGIVFQNNYYGALRPGADGNNLKDRSGGTVIRYNWIENGNRQLDLVESNLGSMIEQDPRYRETHVYGNVLIEGEGEGNRQMIHYGGDNGDDRSYRKGTLHLYNNTVVSERAGRSTLLRLSTDEELCDARNNIIHLPNASGDQLELMNDLGVLQWSHNWLEPGWAGSFFGQGNVVDDQTSIEGDDPGFVDGANYDFRLRSDSVCIDMGTTLNPAVLPANDVVREPLWPMASVPRSSDGTLDIGAYEFAAQVPAPGEVELLMVSRSSVLSWQPEPVSSSYDVIRGDLMVLRTGMDFSVADCVPAAATGTAWSETRPNLASGAQWYLVRGINASGAGTWGNNRDATLAASPNSCP